MRDFVIAGAGMFGAAFARAATDAGYTCIVYDKKPHVAGAAHDEKRGNVHVSSYGAHIFHTNSDEVWRFVNMHAEWTPFINRPKALAKGRVYSLPINMMTLHQLWGVVTPAEAEAELLRRRIPHDAPRNFEEWALSMVGREIYELFFYGYTKKQYHKEPHLLPASIIKRLPIRLTYDENYFSTEYQAMPVDGYADFVNSMLDGIYVELGTPLPKNWRKYGKRLVYSGPVDELADYAFGKLDYNSLDFKTELMEVGDYQGNAVMNHCDESTPHIRTIEYKHFLKDTRKHRVRVDDGKTWLTYDIPCIGGEPLYPILDERNSALYTKYVATKPDDVIFGGRLGEYRYYDMDQAIASALAKVRAL